MYINKIKIKSLKFDAFFLIKPTDTDIFY